MRAPPLESGLLALLLGLTACGAKQASHAPSPADAARAPQAIGAFDVLSVATALDVELVEGPAHSVALSGDARTLEHLEIIHEGPRLRLQLDGELRRPRPIQITVTTPTLRSLELSGASSVRLQGFHGTQALDIAVEGASTVTGSLSVGSLALRLDGSSQAILQGQANSCALQMSGACDAALEQLSCADWRVSASGASDARIHATRSLGPVALRGASALSFGGEPVLAELSVTGVSELSKH